VRTKADEMTSLI